MAKAFLAPNVPLAKKDPQCRHKDVYVAYATVVGGYTAACVNCGSAGAVKPTREDARNDLMRIIADPVLQP